MPRGRARRVGFNSAEILNQQGELTYTETGSI